MVRSEKEAFKTLKEAMKVLPNGGGKIWVKAGKYEEGEITNTAPKANVMAPNVIEGYKNVPGDISLMYYEYVANGKLNDLDPNEMPLFDGLNRSANATFYNVASDNYYIWRNIQITNYQVAFRAATMTGFVADNILIKDMGSLDSSDGYGFEWRAVLLSQI